MTTFVINLLLAILWVAVTGSFTLLNLVFGFALGALAISLIRSGHGGVGYVERGRRIAVLAVYFLGQLMLSAWRVAMVVLRPKLAIEPGIFAFPLSVKSDFEITLLANMITLTPGTLSVDVSEDRSTLYVHALDCSDAEASRREIRDGFERRVREVFE
ncbi:Na+/H+ antiporter subunit E [Consotaella salsifontis]|uniref:Multicomponent Na+:H+ antiporter subunit E n=1 Tax=Consotaella salsifontis TaxID=1365950 RepID=A0A1T4NQE0_9HYPH|nr:Na+/H+ antiporter subunit E [Consotaella salsifontis]SJZ81018.1 multicomponent Na+:H+ antiporter subunit E [Consotaella salsifontis]